MAALIGRDLQDGRFSLAEIHERRARRILPALFAMLLVCAVAAAALILPKLFSDFGASLAGAALFGSNLVFWRRSANYFDAPTDWNPLLHTWSLGVEEQFYILFPVMMMLIWRGSARLRLGLVGAVAIVSFASDQRLGNGQCPNRQLLPAADARLGVAPGRAAGVIVPRPSAKGCHGAGAGARGSGGCRSGAHLCQLCLARSGTAFPGGCGPAGLPGDDAAAVCRRRWLHSGDAAELLGCHL